jgi:hypothetical protein
MHKVAQNVNQAAFVCFFEVDSGWDEEVLFRRIHHTIPSPIMEDRSVPPYRKGDRLTKHALDVMDEDMGRDEYTTERPANSVH